jgi:hypothetical protein
MVRGQRDRGIGVADTDLAVDDPYPFPELDGRTVLVFRHQTRGPCHGVGIVGAIADFDAGDTVGLIEDVAAVKRESLLEPPPNSALIAVKSSTTRGKAQ